MANILDYLDWRGDLPLQAAAFQEVDSLILSCLSYVHFDKVVAQQEEITIREAADRFLALPEGERRIRTKEDETLLQKLGESVRFGGLTLLRCEEKFDEKQEEQFAALTVGLGEAGYFAAYRGTDSTLVGWKEDFNMTFLPEVPAQRDAVRYLEELAAQKVGSLYTGGHSKGGNLAVYAAACCRPEVQARIAAVYNNDGPGFNEEALQTPGYRAVVERVHTYVPQSSLVGMLLEHEEEYTIVHSTQVGGILQHDPYTWEILGPGFCLVDTVTKSSRMLDQTLKSWLSRMKPEQREEFVDSLYRILNAPDARLVSGLPVSLMKNGGLVLQELRDTSPETRQLIQQAFKSLLESAMESVSGQLRLQKEQEQ